MLYTIKHKLEDSKKFKKKGKFDEVLYRLFAESVSHEQGNLQS